jgi:hypothetical protein
MRSGTWAPRTENAAARAAMKNTVRTFMASGYHDKDYPTIRPEVVEIRGIGKRGKEEIYRLIGKRH